MKTIKKQIDISLNQIDLFDLTQDYSKRLEWDIYLSEAYLLNNAPLADVGVDAFCKNKSGSIMISKYISFDRPTVAAVTMTKGPYLLSRFSGAWNIKKIDECHSILIFTYRFELKGGFLGRLFLPVAAYLFSIDMQKRLKAIKTYVKNLPIS